MPRPIAARLEGRPTSPAAVVVLFTLSLFGQSSASGQNAAQSPESPEQARNPGPQSEEGNLAKAVQNPVASLISIPIQNLTDYNIGRFARDRNTVLQFQPVLPARISQNWNLITRIIVPVIYQPDITQPHLGTFGLADSVPSFFFSPAKPGKVIWGAGPAFLIPTGTDDMLGPGKFGIGPTFVALMQPGHWTLGVLVNNLFSVAGSSNRPDVNTMTLQYFVNYNLKRGYYVTMQPIISANWNAASGNIWLIPWGGGIASHRQLGN
jgi:hypothetical protein